MAALAIAPPPLPALTPTAVPDPTPGQRLAQARAQLQGGGWYSLEAELWKERAFVTAAQDLAPRVWPQAAAAWGSIPTWGVLLMTLGVHRAVHGPLAEAVDAAVATLWGPQRPPAVRLRPRREARVIARLAAHAPPGAAAALRAITALGPGALDPAGVEAFIRGLYRDTQRWLADRGITTVDAAGPVRATRRAGLCWWAPCTAPVPPAPVQARIPQERILAVTGRPLPCALLLVCVLPDPTGADAVWQPPRAGA